MSIYFISHWKFGQFLNINTSSKSHFAHTISDTLKPTKTTKMHSFAKKPFVSNKGKPKKLPKVSIIKKVWHLIRQANSKSKFYNSLWIIWRCCSSSQKRWSVVGIRFPILLLITKAVFVVSITLGSLVYSVVPVWSIFVWSSSTDIWFR